MNARTNTTAPHSSPRRTTAAELAERFGLIGGFRSAEGDLALNHSLRVKQRLRAHLDTALTRSIEHTGSARAQRDPAFARALFDEALTLLRAGELVAARALLLHLRRR